MDAFVFSLEGIENFHFVRPALLFLALPLLLIWFSKTRISQHSGWSSVIPPHLAKVLLQNNSSKVSKWHKTLIYSYLLATFAIAGPTWQQIEKPVFQVKRASVIVMDMSLSMRATDLKPNRLTKARFKAMDLAEAIGDGEVALVAYAGDAFTITPLTGDARNVSALIPSLTPEIMPEQGSYPLIGLEKASELLQQAGYLKGDIFWLTDGIEQEDMSELRTFAANTPYRLNILALGTRQGAPIKLVDNSLLKDARGSIVIPKLSSEPLITLANLSGGIFISSTASDADIRSLASINQLKPQAEEQDSEQQQYTGDDWHEFGPYLILLLLPFVLLKFRRGVTFLALVTLIPAFAPQDAIAASNPQAMEEKEIVVKEPSSWRQKVFSTADQIAKEAYDAGDYAQAQADFDNSQWQASAAYKNGDYESALSNFSQDQSAEGWFNQGNTLAHLNRLEEGIKAYEEALKLRPDWQQAKENKDLLEKMLQQQQSDQNQQDSEQESQNEQQQDQQGGQSEDQSSDQQNSEQQNSEQQDAESQSDSQQNSESDSQAEPTDSEESQQQDSQQSEQSSEQQESEQQQQAQQQQSQSEDGEQQGESQQQDYVPLTPEQIAEQEQQQKIEQLLRKVEDDPATLLRNKMILESRRRQQQNRAPKGAKKSW